MQDHPTSNTWLLWQLADSAFPSGGFAHSAGLEAARVGGLLPEPSATGAFAAAALRQQCHTSVPLLRAAYETGRIETLTDLDQLADAMLTNHVAHRASRAMGRALARACFGAFDIPALAALDTALRRGNTLGHLAPCFGYIARHLSLNLDQAAQLFLFQTLRSVMSAAVRLGLLGPLHAQTLTHQLGPAAQDAARRGLLIALDDAADPTPLLTLAQTNQDRIYSRLFQS